MFTIETIKPKIMNIAILAGINDETQQKQFYEQLALNDCYLSGSYMVNILNNTSYNDIDIYHVNTRKDNRLDTTLGDYLIKLGFIAKTLGFNDYMNDKKHTTITKVTNYKLKENKTLQFIQLDHNTTMDAHINTFDISICKNYYSFKTDKFYINDEDGIKNKTFHFINVHTSSPKRFKKYIDYGYNCIDDKSSINIENIRLNTLYKGSTFNNSQFIMLLQDDNTPIKNIYDHHKEKEINDHIKNLDGVKFVNFVKLELQNGTGYQRFMNFITKEEKKEKPNQIINIGINDHNTDEYKIKILQKFGFSIYGKAGLVLNQKPSKVAMVEINPNDDIIYSGNNHFNILTVDIKNICSFDEYIVNNKDFINKNITLLSTDDVIKYAHILEPNNIINACVKNINYINTINNITYDMLTEIIHKINHKIKLNTLELTNFVNKLYAKMNSTNFIELDNLPNKQPVSNPVTDIDGMEKLGYTIVKLNEIAKMTIIYSQIRNWKSNINELKLTLILKNIKYLEKELNNLSKIELSIIISKRAKQIHNNRILRQLLYNKMKQLTFTLEDKMNIVRFHPRSFVLLHDSIDDVESKNKLINLILTVHSSQLKDIDIEKTDERIMTAITCDGLSLEYVDKEKQNGLIISKAFEENPISIKYANRLKIPTDILDKIITDKLLFSLLL